MNMRASSEELLHYIKTSTSPFHVVNTSKEYLSKEGFSELRLTEKWELSKGGKYYVDCYGTTVFAITVGEELSDSIEFRVCAAHTDHPCLKIKPHPEMRDHGYLKINTDVYGGPIVNTWMDRPLSVAGKVAIKSNSIFEPEIRFVDFKRPIMTIPNLAIHMNREVNKGVELNRQKDTIPVLGLVNETLDQNNFFVEALAKELGVEVSDILDFDLYVYMILCTVPYIY